MPIEFRCRQCGRLLRTGDDTAGRQAQCPECGALSTVPALGAGASATQPPGGVGGPLNVPPSLGAGAGSPFGEAGSPLGGTAEGPFAAAGGSAGAAGESENPYQSPTQYGPMPQPSYAAGDPFAASRVSGPATALIVVGSLHVALQVLATIVNLANVGGMMGPAERHADLPPFMLSGGVVVGSGVIGIVVGILVIVGAIKMKNLESYAWAMTSAILAMIPCFWPCCILGLPFGIWALVVLGSGSVKAAFRN